MRFWRGTNINLPSKVYYEKIVDNEQNELEVSIYERKIDGSLGALVLVETFYFEKKDLNTSRSVYKSLDRKIVLTVNENGEKKILSTWMAGTGVGISRSNF
ncbi:MAG: hypothetical protein Q7U04_02080 [Bacteriovorax sp.]|nr:hypothetical protein [Bacteriovorax sp.]